MLNRILTIALAVAAALSALHAEGVSAEPTHRDVTYAQIGERALRLDLYIPRLRTGETTPLVVWIHGGAWRAGSKSSVPVTSWLEDGFAIASIEYRLSPEARFPAQVHDIKAAIRFLRQHASEYGFDATRFVVAGASAGGHLAALVGVSNEYQELEGDVGDTQASSSVQAIVSFYGASNLQSILSQSTAHGLSVRVPALKLLLGDLPEKQPELARLASPISHVDANDPPMFLIHGDADPQMPPEQSDELLAAYRQHQAACKLFVVEGGKHGGEEFYTATRLHELASLLRKSLGLRESAGW